MKKTLLTAAVVSGLSLSAHAAVVFNQNIGTFTEDSAGSGTFSTALITTADGASFNIQVTTDASFIIAGAARLGLTDNRIDVGESLTINNITVTNFTAGSVTLSAADVTNLGFSAFTLDAAQRSDDSGAFAIDGGVPVAWTEFDVVQAPAIVGHTPANAGLDVLANNGGPASAITFTASADGSYSLGSVAVTGMTPNVPEPSSTALFGLAGLGLLARRARK